MPPGDMRISGSQRSHQLAMTCGVGTRYSASDVEPDAVLPDDHMRHHVGGNRHLGGSRRMGEPFDSMATKNAIARVISVEGLRVCDTSLVPTVPCANVDISTFMIAAMIATTIHAGG
jgi:5-(hydroxymethyl)furfural/furfural oxidase